MSNKIVQVLNTSDVNTGFYVLYIHSACRDRFGPIVIQKDVQVICMRVHLFLEYCLIASQPLDLSIHQRFWRPD